MDRNFLPQYLPILEVDDLTVNSTIDWGAMEADELIIDADNTEALLVRKDGDSGDIFNVDTTNERVGINKSSPSAPLEVSGSSGANNGWITIDSDGTGKPLLFEISDNKKAAYNIDSVTEAFQFQTTDSSQDLNNPNARLDIAYDQDQTQVGVDIVTGNTYSGIFNVSEGDFVVDTTGNVGINTASPSFELDVAGEMQYVEDTNNDGMLFRGNNDQKPEIQPIIDGSVQNTKAFTYNHDNSQWVSNTGFRVTGDFNIDSDSSIQLGNSQEYQMRYDSGNTQFEFESKDIDGGGTTGNIFTVADGTQDVNFQGDITASGTIKSDLSSTGVGFDLETSNGNNLEISDENGDDITFGVNGGTSLRFVGVNGVMQIEQKLEARSAIAWGPSSNFKSVLNTNPTTNRFEFQDTNGDRIWSVESGDKIVDFQDDITLQGGNRLIDSTGGRLSLTASTNVVLTPSGNIEMGNDDTAVKWGTGSDYEMIYDSSNTRWEFNSADIDGVGTTGNVFNISDGTQNVNFQGDVTVGKTTNGSGEKVRTAEVNTTDATTTNLNSIAVASDEIIQIEADVVASETADHDEAASYKIIGTFKNDGGTLTQVGSTTSVHEAEDTSGWDVAFNVDDTNDEVDVQVTGAASTDVNWHSSVKTIAVS